MDLNQIVDVPITPMDKMGGKSMLQMTFSQQNDQKNIRSQIRGDPNKKKDSGCTTHTILNKIGDNSSLFQNNPAFGSSMALENNIENNIYTPGDRTA